MTGDVTTHWDAISAGLIGKEETPEKKEQKQKEEMASLLRIGDSFKKIIIVKDDIKPWRWQDLRGRSVGRCSG